MSPDNRRVTAVLGPTNTGKTHYAIDRMLGHRTGVIGLPLRLLAREVYDRIVAARGPSVVALVTGEERIVPDRTQYWVCTVEAMPDGMATDFLAIDEVQLCGDPERGHVFTDRLLRARGLHETLFLGADTMRSIIASLVPEANFMRRERFSELTYAGSKKISRMPPRSAIVGFSVENVYANAEVLRRLKGGAAVVMGALSPRTRNAQVEMYQSGEVDHLVATDAIGMGLNLDIDHVAFSGLRKFDGRRMRDLMPNELAQIAGRAGRHTKDGTFGVTGEASPLDEGLAAAIMENRFVPLKKLQWRNPKLEFGSVDRLIASLEKPPDDDRLVLAREADDLGALKSLADDAEVRARASDGPSVKLLWDVCRIPDFRGISHAEHSALVRQIFTFLHESGAVPDDWFARQIARIDRPTGEIDALSKRLAFIRTWTYVAQRKGWTHDESHWRDETRAVEDRLSDALHNALTQRFVDRRTSVLLRRLKQKERLVANVSDAGEVTVEGQHAGKLEGFRFQLDPSATGDEAKTLRQAAVSALQPEFHLRADRFYNAPDTEIDFTDQGGLMWGQHAIGKLVAGSAALKPEVSAFVDEEAGPEIAEKVARRLQHFIDRKIATLFEPLIALEKDEGLTGIAKGFGFRLGEGLQEFPESPPAGLVTIPVAGADPDKLIQAGYRAAGERAIRIDMLERLADMLRSEDSRGGFEAKADMLSITGMTLEQFANLMGGLGYKAERGEREKVRPEGSAVPEAAKDETADTAEAAPAEETPEPPADAETETPVIAAAPAAPEGPEVEVFYTFTWGGNRGGRSQQNQRRQGGDKKPRGPKGKPKGKPREGGAKKFSSAPPRKEKQIDPNNPFAAALMGLKDKT